jgi:hypothetical protein
MAYRVFREYTGDVHLAYRECRNVVQENVAWLLENPGLPDLLDCDFVAYLSDPPRRDTYYTIPQIIRRGGDDCEGLAAWLAAEDIARRGFQSRVIFYRRARWPRGRHHAVTLRHGPPLDYAPYIRFEMSGGRVALDPCMPKGMHEYLLRQKELKSCR